jgi:hypothetical protein
MAWMITVLVIEASYVRSQVIPGPVRSTELPRWGDVTV